MGKIISTSWVEKNDPIFTGRFTISSKKQIQNKENSNSLRAAIRREKNPKSFREMYVETPVAQSHKKEN